MFISNSFNPYLQILENSSRKISKISVFRVMSQTRVRNRARFLSWFRTLSQIVLLENSSIKILWEPIQFVLNIGQTISLDEFSSNTVWLTTRFWKNWFISRIFQTQIFWNKRNPWIEKKTINFENRIRSSQSKT